MAGVFCTFPSLVETMRREGYEFQLGQPKVIIKTIDGVKHEPD
jgi:GTP-binding protein